jgi:hypothetical protein
VSHPRLRILLAALALAVGASGCATSSPADVHHAGGILSGREVADSNNDGAYIQAGGITYQLEISRVLNPWGAEDSQYFKGLPKGMPIYRIKPDQLWYGVFLWAKNQHHHPITTASNFKIVDTYGDVYRPIKLNPNLNPFAWNPRTLVYGETEPSQDSIASQFYSGGKLILFRLNTSIYSNRPLTLYILSSSGQELGSISLDL